MPRRTERQRQAEDAVKEYVNFRKLRADYLAHRERRFRRRRRGNAQTEASALGVHPRTRISTAASLPSESSDSSDSLLSSDAHLGDDDTSMGSLSSSSDSTSTTTTNYSSGDNSSSTSSSSASTCCTDDSAADSSNSEGSTFGPGSFSNAPWSDSDGLGGGVELDDGDTNWSDGDELSTEEMVRQPGARLSVKLGRFVRRAVMAMYSSRYEKPRIRFPRPPSHLLHVLDVLKHARPDHFRQELRVNPYTFDSIVNRIKDDPVFSNNSNNPQMPVEQQVAITLYRFGHFGNAASLDKVAKWAGYAKGTVHLATKRVMKAVLRKDFIDEAVSLPTAEEKEAAKEWVESRSCSGWRDGWCLVDGTLVPLFERPYWYGESYFDRKSNYSLNFQIISLPNLRIIDFGYGFTGSTHDATAWEQTKIFKQHEDIFREGEFVWADSAYPVSISIMIHLPCSRLHILFA
ncbi:hypothetical protein CPC08DRAFT_634216 [Agrocybe pediades]|nr:hypothetical protein CPC08DRAFT_634216 [Agrocybe pediades]